VPIIRRNYRTHATPGICHSIYIDRVVYLSEVFHTFSNGTRDFTDLRVTDVIINILFCPEVSFIESLSLQTELGFSVHFYPLQLSVMLKLHKTYSSIYPTRCNFAQFIYIWKLLYMFRAVPPPIIRSTNNCIYSI